MGENTSIEWCHHTFNSHIGCQKVSPGCDFCYAETQNNFRKWNGGEWGPHAPRKRTSVANWRKPLHWNAEAATAGTRYRVFCASLADWLDNKADQSIRVDLAALIDQTPNLDWMLLSKRLENWGKLSPWRDIEIPRNVWIGATAENQQLADRRGRQLREIPARIRFFSCEPLLSDIRFETETLQALDLVISGGESGSKDSRASDVQWHRHIRDQCAAAGVHYLFKQWGDWNDGGQKVGKKRAGRLLDGVEHNGMPA